MGILDSAQDMLGRGAQAAQGVLDKGVTVAKGAVSGVAVEQQPFMKAFVRLCTDGWDQGWHERNGGNLTYRLTDEQVGACRPFFYDNPSSWVSMGVQADNPARGVLRHHGIGPLYAQRAARPCGQRGHRRDKRRPATHGASCGA